MGNKVIEQIVNPFIRIAGMKALGWGVLGLAVDMGLSGLNSIYLIVLDIGLSLSWFASFWTGPQSGLVVLFGGAFDRVADSCVTVLSWRCFFVTFPHSYSRCVGHCAVCPVTVTGDEFN